MTDFSPDVRNAKPCCLDKTDIAIVRELFQGLPSSPIRPETKLSFRQVAKRLGLAEGTVRSRTKKLVDSGFIRGWAVHPNPGLLGLSVGVLGFEVGVSPKREVVEKLRLVEGNLLLVDYHKSYVGMVFFYDDAGSLRRKVDLISKIAAASEQSFYRVPFLPCRYRLSLTDWMIVLSLQEDHKKSYRKVGAELGLSARTVMRRVERMCKEGATFLLASANERALKGATRADLMVKWGDASVRAEAQENVLRVADEFCFFHGLWTDMAVLNLLIPNVPTSAEILEKVSVIEGVESARIEFVRERHESYELLGELVQRKVAETAASRPPLSLPG